MPVADWLAGYCFVAFGFPFCAGICETRFFERSHPVCCAVIGDNILDHMCIFRSVEFHKWLFWMTGFPNSGFYDTENFGFDPRRDGNVLEVDFEIVGDGGYGPFLEGGVAGVDDDEAPVLCGERVVVVDVAGDVYIDIVGYIGDIAASGAAEHCNGAYFSA